MNCTASCFVVGPHLMMVSETFPLHLFPLGLTTTEKDKGPTGAFTGPRDSSPGTPCVPQLGARRAYPHAPARSRGFPPARERCRPPGAARRSRDSYASRKPSSAVTVRNVSTLFPYARYSTVVRLKLAYGEHLANCYYSDITGLVEPGYSFVWLSTRPIPDYRKL